LIVICWKFEWIGSCHILIEKRVVLNDTETLGGVVIVPLSVAIKFFVRVTQIASFSLLHVSFVLIDLFLHRQERPLHLDESLAGPY
jgi:hypothetical protein